MLGSFRLGNRVSVLLLAAKRVFPPSETVPSHSIPVETVEVAAS
jgi:hypothetical protein